MSAAPCALIGYGRFGQAFADLLIAAGHPVVVVDPHADIPAERSAPSIESALEHAEWVVLAVPVPRLHATLRELRPWINAQHCVMDVGSVKQYPMQWMDAVLGGEIAHVGSHPLFGPLSLARGDQPLTVVICASSRHPHSADRAQAFYQGLGCEVIRRDAAEHDQAMAETHALAFYIARALVDMGVGEDLSLAPPSFRGLGNMLAAVRGDAGHLFSAIQRENPYSAAARQRFLDTLIGIHQRLHDEGDDQTLAIPS